MSDSPRVEDRPLNPLASAADTLAGDRPGDSHDVLDVGGGAPSAPICSFRQMTINHTRAYAALYRQSWREARIRYRLGDLDFARLMDFYEQQAEMYERELERLYGANR